MNKRKIENVGYPTLFNVKENLYSSDSNIFNSASQHVSAQMPSANNFIYSGDRLYSNLMKTRSSALDMLYNNDFLTSTPAKVRISAGNMETLDLLKPVIQPLKLSALVDKKNEKS